jgi:hypothetical protein
VKAILTQIQERIRQAAQAAGRPPGSVRLVAVGKTQPIQMIRAAIDAGATDIGENYLQEAREKFSALGALPVSWHFIGHMQTNKAKYAVRIFDLIHSVDSVKLARELNRQAERIGKIQDILIQVNLSGEASKSGIAAEEARPVLEQIAPLSHIQVRGLMTLPPYFDNPEKARPFFRELRHLRDEIRDRGIANISLDELSMGMTGDFEAAIAEGATLVRIGTALFGSRR